MTEDDKNFLYKNNSVLTYLVVFYNYCVETNFPVVAFQVGDEPVVKDRGEIMRAMHDTNLHKEKLVQWWTDKHVFLSRRGFVSCACLEVGGKPLEATNFVFARGASHCRDLGGTPADALVCEMNYWLGTSKYGDMSQEDIKRKVLFRFGRACENVDGAYGHKKSCYDFIDDKHKRIIKDYYEERLTLMQVQKYGRVL
jgi:hypothetical protein